MGREKHMLYDRITEDVKTAMKNKEEARLSVLRMVLAAMKNKRIDLLRDLTEAEAQGVVRILVKQYGDALADFTRGDRKDLADKTAQEILILESYVPAAPTEATVRAVVSKKIEELGAKSAADFGKVMGAAMKELPGVSGDAVTKVVRELLK